MNIPLFSSQVILPNEGRKVSSDFSQQGCRMSELALNRRDLRPPARVVLLSIENHGFRLEGIQRFWYGLESLDPFRLDPQLKIRRITLGLKKAVF